jgi:hypothetical protein
MSDFRVARSASRNAAGGHSAQTKPIAQWRDLDAYVLLGDPGAGKTGALEAECDAEGGKWFTAGDVVAGIEPTDLAGSTVFIDGLDEVRAGAPDRRAPLMAIRNWLIRSQCRRFRMSCREADWLGDSDRQRLLAAAPGGTVHELHLEPLSDADIDDILASREAQVPDRSAFRLRVEQAGLAELFRNPLLLDLIIKVGANGKLPRSRAGIYEEACRQLAREHNNEYRDIAPAQSADAATVLADAGKLFAVALLSGKSCVARRDGADTQAVEPSDLAVLSLHDFSKCVSSKLFTYDGGLAYPRHRTIAEYLAGQALAKCIEEGLPLGRAKALMQGIDGFPVEPLRGLWAWLAFHHPPSRSQLVEIDPLGVVLNGDVASFGTEERLGVLHSLRRMGQKDPWFLNAMWVTHPFGPLATADLQQEISAILKAESGGTTEGSFINCLFDALRHGEPLPALVPTLERWIEDKKASDPLRGAAYEAWKHCGGFVPQRALHWLREIRAGKLQDSQHELTNVLLVDLYPQHITPSELPAYWQNTETGNTSYYSSFWDRWIWVQTPQGSFSRLADAWLKLYPSIHVDALDHYSAVQFPARLLKVVLEHEGDAASDVEIYRWLGLALDEYGFPKLERQEHSVREWLSKRPERLKSVVLIGLRSAPEDAIGNRPFWQAETRLYGASLPVEWNYWLLQQAAKTDDAALAQFCFQRAASAAVNPVSGLQTPTLEEIESWVQVNLSRWPQAEEWRGTSLSSSLEFGYGDRFKRQRVARAAEQARTRKRGLDLESHIPALIAGTAPPRLLQQIAVAYRHGFTDVRGDTPLERVRNFLVTDDVTARAVVSALPNVLSRDDLPSVKDTIAADMRNSEYPLTRTVLIAAQLVYAKDTNAALQWPKALVERLTAYFLTSITNDDDSKWFRDLAVSRPEWIAPIALKYAKEKLKGKGVGFEIGIPELGGEPTPLELTQLILPSLLKAFPLQASEPARRALNQRLLPALAILGPHQAKELVSEKLGCKSLDAAQRICWLVADLPFRAEAAQELVALVGDNERRAVVLGQALHGQRTLHRVVAQLQPKAISRLIELLAPITDPKSHWRDSWVTDTHERGDTVQALLAALASNPDPQAKDELKAFAGKPGLAAWASQFQYNLRTHLAVAREAHFVAPTSREVAAVLAKLAPSQCADLRALVVFHLSDLRDRWRGADSFELRRFWTDGPVRKPRTEPECCSLLLEQLKLRLRPLNIAVTPERLQARQKRADFVVEFLRDGRRKALPVEVKKQDHRELWTACRDQLQSLYTVDPETEGFGLYLVLWFGVKTHRHPEGLKFNSAQELELALHERIPAEDRHRLMVQVLDLSWPEP